MSSNIRTPTLTVAECLETLEEVNFFTKKSRSNALENIHLILQDKDGSVKVTSQEVLRILAVFEKCLKLDIQSIPHALNTVLSLLTKPEVISNLSAPDLLPSALAVVQMLKTLCALETQHLKTMGVQVFLSYPDDVIAMIVRENCSEVLEIFKDFAPQMEQGVSKSLQIFLSGLLTKLPVQEKKQLMQDGLSIWFQVISVVMDICASITGDDGTILDCIEYLEGLTEALVHIDYSKNPLWQNEILKCICSTYPATILKQLQNNISHWHRFWIVFVKLLKNQITRNCTYGTPIQPMLEVVETAFKMNSENRCRAFQCWDVLIDNLSTDTNPKSTPRYLKLLLIPLKPNNAKTEETARAKFYTWWNLIRKFQAKLDQFRNEVLLAFLHFIFGKKLNFKKHLPQFSAGAGQTYDSIKILSLQAFVEIVGHDANCDCCTDFPKLNEKMLNNKLLANNWDEWMCALKTSILITNTLYETDKDTIRNKPMQVLCAWRAFVVSIAELPPNGVRKDMFNELIQVLMDLLQLSNVTDTLPDVLFSLALSLTEGNESIRKLLLTPKDNEQPLRKIISIVLNPKMAGFFSRHKTIKMVEILQPLTDLVIDSLNFDCCLRNLSHNSCSLKLWTALAHSINEADIYVDTNTLRQTLLWPVQAMEPIDMDNYAATVWQTLYNNYKNKTNDNNFDRDVCEYMKANPCKYYFKVFLASCIMKNMLLDSHNDVGPCSEVFEKCTVDIIPDYKLYQQAVPIIVDTIVMMLDNVLSSSDEKLAKVSVNCAKNILLMIFFEIKSQDNKAGYTIDSNLFVMVDNIFKAIHPIIEIPLYSNIVCGFLGVLKDCSINDTMFKFILSKVKYLHQNCTNNIIKSKINECIEMLLAKSNTIANNTSSAITTPVKVFSSPNVNKRSKRKEALIVNTVTENGEEYAVVKSNWKFNPKKLTENQKERLKRKREDIPALYQDLSQSQDEFKLSKWKTDSQDTTTSSNSKSSKFTTNGNASNILKNIQSSDVVPNIMQNILSENDKNHTIDSIETNMMNSLLTVKSDKFKQSSPSTPKNTKSPRMALKDRVFRNVRNLIEKSSPKTDTIDAIIGESQLKTTPTAKTTNNANIINSAPAQMCADRPSRVRRRPKKFADVEMISLKKRRLSQTDSLSHSENEIETSDELNQDGVDKSNDKAKLSVISRNEVYNLSALGHIDVKVDTVEDVQELIVIPLTQNESTKDASDKIMTENLSSNHNGEITSDTQKKSNDLNSDTNNEHDKQQNEEKKSDSQTHDDIEEAQTIPKDVSQDIRQSDGSPKCQQNDKVQNIQMDSVCDNQKKIFKDKVTDGKVPVDLSSKTDDKNKDSTLFHTPVQKVVQAVQKETAKKSIKRRSRIEKELAIDTVEGHPYLKKQSEKRLTRKQIMESENTSRRKSVPQKTNKTKPQTRSPKTKEKSVPNSPESSSAPVEEAQERNILPEDAPCSEDVIESSQDSNFTTITVKSTKRTPKRQPVVAVERLKETTLVILGTQELLQSSDCEILRSTYSYSQETKDDIELPQNKTAEIDKNNSELTENMDTEPVIDEKMDDDVIIINDDRESPITLSSSDKSVGLDIEELAEADTQPNDPADIDEYGYHKTSPIHPETQTTIDITENMTPNQLTSVADSQENVIEISAEPYCNEKDTDICSPFKGDAQRKQDFLNNTSEISPIKVQSPDKDKTSPEKNIETSSDYLLVKLSSPVHSNGEPFSSKGSPEFFTEDKTSPDKLNQSPPRPEVSTNSGSPSSSLSLKKNRPQTLRPGGRAAHMVGLCVPDSMGSKNNSEKAEPEEPKKQITSTPARRNLRVLYNAVSDNNDTVEDNEQDNFLKLKKTLPSVDSSPSVPILKRKFNIADDTTASPASKRKRVSFHDPPVSTTVSVQKYIKPDSVESPSTAHKRLEVPMTRNLTKSPKRLDNAFKLDTVLSKAIESFQEQPADSLNNDTNVSLDVTPAVEVVNTSELNDMDPICPDLVDCKDPIDNIAVELSSPAMKDLFVKELDGKVLTVGDLAKMTELEVYRLCIKAPKIQVAKKVLDDYNSKIVVTAQEVLLETEVLVDETAIATEMNEDMTDPKEKTMAVDTQTDIVSLCQAASQTKIQTVHLASTQTTSVSTVDTNSQTLESGYKSTSEIITSCLSEREDFLGKLGELIPTDKLIDILVNKDDCISDDILTKLLNRQSQNLPNDARNSKELSVIKNVLIERFNHRDLVVFCGDLYQELYNQKICDDCS